MCDQKSYKNAIAVHFFGFFPTSVLPGFLDFSRLFVNCVWKSFFPTRVSVINYLGIWSSDQFVFQGVFPAGNNHFRLHIRTEYGLIYKCAELRRIIGNDRPDQRIQ